MPTELAEPESVTPAAAEQAEAIKIPVDDGGWSSMSVKQRVRVLGRLRHVLAEQAERFVKPLRELPTRTHDAETLSAEVLPLAEACRWLEKDAPRLLRPEKLGGSGRPMWLWGVDSEVRREPVGNVLVIGPGNYPLFLPGVQVVQALAAGNRVWVKPSPAPGSREVILELAAALREVGLPEGVFNILGTDPAEAEAIFDTFDKVFLTGSEATGKAVQAKCAEHGIPCVMELSGCDAVFVLGGADVELAAKCVAFGLKLNGSATCIAPRRVLVHHALHDRFVTKLLTLLADAEPVACPPATLERVRGLVEQAVADGGQSRTDESLAGPAVRPVLLTDLSSNSPILDADIFAPVVSVLSVKDTADALEANACCGYRLGASVFGPESEARALAEELDVGCVVVNDVVVPTADPRLPFAGRGRSGFGATRGAAGLLEMTQVKAIAVRRRKLYPHLRPTDETTAPLLAGLLKLGHAEGISARVRAGMSLLRLSKRPKNAVAEVDQESTS
ncbi:MAG: aldehyde dehydrogenase family protein [Planctomycetota bacterium]